jgi:hypothetical protein
MTTSGEPLVGRYQAAARRLINTALDVDRMYILYFKVGRNVWLIPYCHPAALLWRADE